MLDSLCNCELIGENIFFTSGGKKYRYILTVKLLIIAIVKPPSVPANKNDKTDNTKISNTKSAHLCCSAFIFSIRKFPAVTIPMIINSIT